MNRQQQQLQAQRARMLAAKAHNMKKVGAEPISPGTPGFLSPQLPPRDEMSLWALYWNEFLGTLVYALAGRLFVGFFGGSTAAATIPTLYGTAFANAFAFFGAMATFGAVSGGHFNPAITLAVLLIELGVRWGLYGEKDRVRQLWPGRNWWGLLPYFLVQFIAFIFAALLIWAFLPAGARNTPIDLGIPYVSNVVNDGKTFGAEIVGSFLFLACYLILLKMFDDKGWIAQAIRALAFGFWYFALILVFAPWAGAVWNPSLWLAFAIVSNRWTDWWILLWPAIISSFAAAVFCLVHWWISRPIPTRLARLTTPRRVVEFL